MLTKYKITEIFVIAYDFFKVFQSKLMGTIQSIYRDLGNGVNFWGDP